MDNVWGAEDVGGEEEDTTARTPITPLIVPSNPPTTTPKLLTPIITDYFPVIRRMSGSKEAQEIEELWRWDEEEGVRFLTTLCDDTVDEEYEEYLLTQGEDDYDSSGVSSATIPSVEGGDTSMDDPVSCVEASLTTPPQEEISEKDKRVTNQTRGVTSLRVHGETCVETTTSTPPHGPVYGVSSATVPSVEGGDTSMDDPVSCVEATQHPPKRGG